MFQTLHTLTEENHHLFTHTKYIFTFEGKQGKRDRDVKSRLACVFCARFLARASAFARAEASNSTENNKSSAKRE